MNQQQPQTKKTSRATPILIIIVVILAIGVGIYAYLTQTGCEKKVVDTNSNTNAVSNTNVAITQTCGQIIDEDECIARKDCLPVNVCECDTEYKKRIRCGGEGVYPCFCTQFEFDYCEDLVCDGVRSTKIFNGAVSIECQSNNGCTLVDKIKDLSECCSVPVCTDYSESKYVAVNEESLRQLNIVAKGDDCDYTICPQYEQVPCKFEGKELTVQCIDNKCAKVQKTDGTTAISNWQTYEDQVNGYSIKYPADYLIKMETNGYVVFDPTSIDSPDTTYLHISVTVEDNDFHTYRLGILTNPAVDNDSPISEVDVTIDGLDAKKITLKNALGETVIHYIVSYLGKVYDISAGDSVDSQIIDTFVASFDIWQLGESIDIADTEYFDGRTCDSNNDCGAFPCVNGGCLVKKCTCSCHCPGSVCGGHETPVPGYCTTMDVL